MTTMEIEHDAGNIHLSAAMQDGAQHPYRVAMTDGGAAIVMPKDTTWVQSIVIHGMPTEMMNDGDTMGRMLASCWEIAECCRDAMGDMRAMAATAGGRMSGAGSSGSSDAAMMGPMVTIVCGSATINLTM